MKCEYCEKDATRGYQTTPFIVESDGKIMILKETSVKRYIFLCEDDFRGYSIPKVRKIEVKK